MLGSCLLTSRSSNLISLKSHAWGIVVNPSVRKVHSTTFKLGKSHFTILAQHYAALQAISGSGCNPLRSLGAIEVLELQPTQLLGNNENGMP